MLSNNKILLYCILRYTQHFQLGAKANIEANNNEIHHIKLPHFWPFSSFLRLSKNIFYMQRNFLSFQFLLNDRKFFFSFFFLLSMQFHFYIFHFKFQVVGYMET